MLDYIGEEYSPHSSFLIGLESSVDEVLLPPPRELAAKELVLGASGSLLAHVLMVLATLMMAYMQPPGNFPGTFVTVSLVSSEWMAGGSGSPGSDESFGKGGRSGTAQSSTEYTLTEAAVEATAGLPKETVHPEEAHPKQKQPEDPVAPDVPKALKRVEQVAAAEGNTKRATIQPERKPRACPKPTSPEQKEAVSLPAVQESSAETEGTGLNSGKEQGSEKGEGGSSGALASDGSPHGKGSNEGEFNVNAVDQIPQVLKKVEPAYPHRARHLSVSGKVVVKFLVEADGHVSKPSILEAKPEGYFEENALEAIRRWRFKPGYSRGKAVATWVTLPVQFRLTE